ncbi:ThiF family adenylyltransferase [Ralstonia mojiangensis]|uniref:ThiF family adenylyltransferase n=1 Tax=Ralstonia mojiangensis TaxID=2953895 RepID=UPI0021B32A14|nr:ThiF family adenylyltransferase [Ralstonia mojiangensis]MCT7327326.1 ThiF family adenylyltransferase [Ralstonia mojiangensis]
MRTKPTLVIPAAMHRALQAHLLTGDGREAAAILICSRISGSRVKLMVKDVVLVPHAASVREPDFLSWPSAYVEHALDVADECDFSLVLIHSHPGGLFEFSTQDDRSDQEIIPAMHLARSTHHSSPMFHGSAIMVPGGAVKARLFDSDGHKHPVELVGVYGDDLRFYWCDQPSGQEACIRPLAFTSAMTAELSRLSVCVIGVSGTGSIVAEQLARLGVGELMLVDFDHVEEKNLNRILNSTRDDARAARLKVDVVADAIATHHPRTTVHRVAAGIEDPRAIAAAAEADIIFCCIDREKGRLICDRLASACLMPLFDVGVTIPVGTTSKAHNAIMGVVGRVDYVQPGGSSLMEREVYTPQSLRAEELRETAPEAYAKEVENNYLPGTQEEAPAVIAVNMKAASAVVLEFLARAYPFRFDTNRFFARSLFCVASGEEDHEAEDAWDHRDCPLAGTGLTSSPLLGLPSLEQE